MSGATENFGEHCKPPKIEKEDSLSNQHVVGYGKWPESEGQICVMAIDDS